tara:strand:+ start:3120 stop:3377 length:258 start_codon:yes stop_codon:yes gene_type:complete
MADDTVIYEGWGSTTWGQGSWGTDLIIVSVDGVQATGAIGTVIFRVWTSVDDSQTPSWQDITGTQTPTWGTVTTTQTPSWQDIVT